MGIYECLWEFMGVYGFLGVYRGLWISGCLWVFMGGMSVYRCCIILKH